MSHRDPASGSTLGPRHFAYIVLALVPLSVWSCNLLDATSIDINAAGSGGSGGSAAGSGGSGGVTMAGSGGSGGATGGSSGSAGAGATGGSSGSSGSAGAGATGGTGGTVEDPDGGADAAAPDPDSGGGSTSTFNCTSGDSACALCEVWTQLVDCQPANTCPDEQRGALVGLGCDAQYAAYLDCYATEPVTSSVCAGSSPSTRLADARLGGMGTENNCQAQECALYDCLGALAPPGCP